MMIGLCLIWLFLDVVAMELISLEINNTLTDCDDGYIEINCTVDFELMSTIFSISLKRYDEEVASVLDSDKLQSKELANRSGVTVNGMISKVDLPYLSIKIMGLVVDPLKDTGPYQCFSIGLDVNQASIKVNSTLEMLNITECSKPTTEIQLRTSASTVKSQSGKNKITMGMYRELIVVTGVLICCILLLIMVREIRIHYCTSEDIVYV